MTVDAETRIGKLIVHGCGSLSSRAHGVGGLEGVIWVRRGALIRLEKNAQHVVREFAYRALGGFLDGNEHVCGICRRSFGRFVCGRSHGVDCHEFAIHETNRKRATLSVRGLVLDDERVYRALVRIKIFVNLTYDAERNVGFTPNGADFSGTHTSPAHHRKNRRSESLVPADTDDKFVSVLLIAEAILRG